MRCSSFFAVFLLLFLMNFPSVISDYRAHVCNNASTYTDGDQYSTNLDRVITDLLANAPRSSGFNTSSRGQPPSKVYGLLQCIGNASIARCSNCSREANNNLKELCANDVGGRVWMDDCFLRYDNSNFISTLNTDFYVLWNTKKVTNNLQAFQTTTSSLLTNLSEEAYNPANKLFAAGSATYSTSNTLYGLVQCWRDLSLNDCKKCVFTAREDVKSCCSTNQGARAISGSCTVRYESYPFFESAESASPSPSPSPAPEPSSPTSSTSTPPSAEAPSPAKATLQTKSNKKSSKTLPITLGLVGGISLALVICLIGLRKRVRAAVLERPVTQEDGHGFSPESRLLNEEQHFIFTLEALAEATQNFHDNNKLGEGGFGAVYKGITRDGNEIAVKKLSARSTQGKNEFMNEVKLMANVQHRNLVKLLGCCAEGDERLLVYEYFPNKSLDTFLFDPEKRRELDWQKRYNIIMGIARGLLYLHEDSQMRIIHRDIKANNILLDDKLNPKIADFGLARLFPEDETQIQTRVAGTLGYMAPEYAMRGQLSIKADVYSFGVVLLEIVSGRKNTDMNFPHEMQNLLEWAWRLYKAGNVLNMVDSTLSETCRQEQALRCIHVGILCVQADATLRPAMSNVNMMISSNSVTLPNLSEPAFVNISERHGSNSGVEEAEKGITSQTSGTNASTSSASGVPSVNEASVSNVDPR